LYDSRVTAFEYARVPWDEIGRHAAQGWRLMPIPPMPETKVVLGSMQMTGVILYHLERELPAGPVPDDGAVSVTRPESDPPPLVFGGVPSRGWRS
jgi:hypothetical protein